MRGCCILLIVYTHQLNKHWKRSNQLWGDFNQVALQYAEAIQIIQFFNLVGEHLLTHPCSCNDALTHIVYTPTVKQPSLTNAMLPPLCLHITTCMYNCILEHESEWNVMRLHIPGNLAGNWIGWFGGWGWNHQIKIYQCHLICNVYWRNVCSSALGPLYVAVHLASTLPVLFVVNLQTHSFVKCLKWETTTLLDTQT